MSVSRLKHVTKIGVEQMGDLADSLNDTDVLRLENLTRTSCLRRLRLRIPKTRQTTMTPTAICPFWASIRYGRRLRCWLAGTPGKITNGRPNA